MTYAAPHGTDVHVLQDGEVVDFGRDGSCAVRFAYAPVADQGVARVAGRLLVAGGRVFVESRGAQGHRALEVRADGSPVVQLGHGEGFSPRSSSFEVLVHGDRAWRLQVDVRHAAHEGADDSNDPPTNRLTLELTPAQRRVLEAYSAPVLRGRLEPATHNEVAGTLDLHANTVREALYEVYARMFTAGIPMPDVTDKRVAVVEAARLHGLVGIDHA